MNSAFQNIPLVNLAIAFIPVAITIGVLAKWELNARRALYAVSRMLLQLLLVGYFLSYIFSTDDSWVVLLTLMVMVTASSWIALQSVAYGGRLLYWHALIAILAGGGVSLLLVTQGVLRLSPWYEPSFVIPLAGMTFSNAMNSISLAAERLDAELRRENDYDVARNIAMQTCLIPLVNAMFAVGLVALPGMMTGQILSGVSPLIAVRYQIMAMCMIFGSAGLSAAIFLVLAKRQFQMNKAQQSV